MVTNRDDPPLVLVIDDTDVSADVLSRHLAADGHRVAVAHESEPGQVAGGPA
jgi:CheY-like chemotaxis protein